MNGLRLIRVLLPMVQAIILLAASVETCDSARLKSEYFEYHPFGVASVVTENDRAYVSATDGVRIYDIKRPKRPQLLGFYKSEAANDIKVEGNYAFVCGGLINKEKGYLKILDISSPARIKLAGEALLSHGSVGVEIAKNHAYVSGLGEGLFIIDVSNKNSPKLVRKANFPRVENPMAVAKIVSRLKKGPKKFPLKLGRTWWTHIEGNFLYANDENTGLHVLEISNPKNPIEIGSLIHEFMPKSTQLAVEAFNDIDVENNIGFITLDNGGMVIVDLQNKNHPIILYHYNPWKGYNWKTSPGHMIKIEVMGNLGYVKIEDNT